MTFLKAEEVNLLRGIFLVREVSKFSAVGWDSSLSHGFPQIFTGRMGKTLGDNPAVYYFVLGDLVPTSFFQ